MCISASLVRIRHDLFDPLREIVNITRDSWVKNIINIKNTKYTNLFKRKKKVV